MKLIKKLLTLTLSAGLGLSSALLPVFGSTLEGTPYIDVNDNDWYGEHVRYCYEKGLMTGSPDSSHFAPWQDTSRGMLVTILHRKEGKPSASKSDFLDVVDSAWNAKAIHWAAQEGIVNGYNRYKFGPSDSLTREQMAKILKGYAAYKGEDTSQRASLNDYVDTYRINPVMVESMQWAVAEGLMGQGTSRLDPSASIPRCQVAAVLSRYFSQKEAEPEVPDEPEQPEEPDQPDLPGEPDNTAIDTNAILDAEVTDAGATILYTSNRSGILEVEILPESFEEYKDGVFAIPVYETSTQASSGENREASVSFSQSLPQEYVTKITLKSGSTELCDPYYDLSHTRTFAEFEQTDYQDLIQRYGSQRALNFDSQSDQNIAALAEDVSILDGSSSNVLSQESIESYTIDGQIASYSLDGYLISNPSKDLQNIYPGQSIYFKDASSQPYLFRVGSVEERGSDLYVEPQENVPLNEFYSFMKVDQVQTKAQTASAPKVETASDSYDFDKEYPFTLFEKRNSFELTSERYPGFSVTGGYSAIVQGHSRLIYDFEKLGRDFFFCDAFLTAKATAEIHFNYQGKVEFEMVMLPKEEIPTEIPGLYIEGGLSIPIEGSFEGTIGGTLTVTGQAGFTFDTVNHLQKINTFSKDFTPSMEAKAELRFGPKITTGISICKSLNVDLDTWIGLDVTAETYTSMLNEREGESYHECNLCIDGAVDYFIQIHLLLNATLGDWFDHDFIDTNIIDIQNDLIFPGVGNNNFFVSLISPYDSYYKGLTKMGFGKCQNYEYKIGIKVEDDNGSSLSGESIQILNEAGNVIEYQTAPFELWLCNGTYRVQFNQDPDSAVYFSVSNQPTSVTIKKSAPAVKPDEIQLFSQVVFEYMLAEQANTTELLKDEEQSKKDYPYVNIEHLSYYGWFYDYTSNIGYSIEYLAGDDTPYLVVYDKSVADQVDGVGVIDVFTNVDGKIYNIETGKACSGYSRPRDSLSIREDGTIVRNGNGGAYTNSYKFYRVQPGQRQADLEHSLRIDTLQDPVYQEEFDGVWVDISRQESEDILNSYPEKLYTLTTKNHLATFVKK